jgi:hypothetical protein
MAGRVAPFSSDPEHRKRVEVLTSCIAACTNAISHRVWDKFNPGAVKAVSLTKVQAVAIFPLY